MEGTHPRAMKTILEYLRLIRWFWFGYEWKNDTTAFVDNIKITSNGSVKRTYNGRGSRDKWGRCRVTTDCAGKRTDDDCGRGKDCLCVCHLLDRPYP